MNEKENVPATSQNNSGCEVLQRVYRPAGRSHMLKMRICVYTSRRLQWIVINCKRNLQQRQSTLYKNKCWCTSFKSPRTLKSGGHLFSRTWELFWMSCLSLSLQVIKFASATGFPSVFGRRSLIDSADKKKIRAYRQSFSAWRWAAEVIRPLHWDLKFDFECPRAVRFTWTKWHWKLVHSPYQHPSASCLRKKMLVTGFPVLVMNFQPLFADSLTSTLLDWLGYATGFSVIARLHSHIQLMLESVLSLYFPAVMVLEVMYQTSLTSKRSSINPGPR